MRVSAVLLLVGLWACSAAANKSTEANDDNFDSLVHDSSKNAFVMFRAPWCGHCKKMKPAWDELADDFADSEHVSIIHVDCTASNAKSTCGKYGVRGYPTIKYFAGEPLGAKYEGGRSYEDLKSFAEETLGPSCDFHNKEICDDDDLKFMGEWEQKTREERQKRIDDDEKAIKDSEDELQELIKKLQGQFERATKAHDDLVAEKKKPLKLLKSIQRGVPGEPANSEL